MKTYHLTECTDQATHYYVIPKFNIAIPKCPNSQRTLVTLLAKHHEVGLPISITEYPLVTRRQLTTFYCDYSIISVRVHYTKRANADFKDYSKLPAHLYDIARNMD